MATVQASITAADVLLGVYVCFKGVCAVKGKAGGGGERKRKRRANMKDNRIRML